MHHVGLACRDINATLEWAVAAMDVADVHGPIHDPRQQADLCMITTAGGSRIELVSGRPVEAIVARGTTPYHLCFEVPDMDVAIAALAAEGCRTVVPPLPAVLFNGARVAFLLGPLGLIELLEVGG